HGNGPSVITVPRSDVAVGPQQRAGIGVRYRLESLWYEYVAGSIQSDGFGATTVGPKWQARVRILDRHPRHCHEDVATAVHCRCQSPGNRTKVIRPERHTSVGISDRRRIRISAVPAISCDENLA